MADVIETDYTTNPATVTERDFTPAEIEQQIKDMQDAQAAADAAEAKMTAEAQARTAAIDHAKSIGFTDEMIAVMYPNLVATS
jgi:hypothetical protein